MRHLRLSHDQLRRRSEALTRPCDPAPRGCGAPTGEPCTNVRTGDPLVRQLAHPCRLHPRSSKPSPTLPTQRQPDVRELAASSHR